MVWMADGGDEVGGGAAVDFDVTYNKPCGFTGNGGMAGSIPWTAMLDGNNTKKESNPPPGITTPKNEITVRQHQDHESHASGGWEHIPHHSNTSHGGGGYTE